jgi:hypothetical protein
VVRILTFFVLTASINLFGQNSFKAEIDSIYNFQPHKLSRAEQGRIFPVLDKFFEKIKSDTGRYLPLLRHELRSKDHLPYFYYDCSHLLMTISKRRTDRQLCAESFVKCNLKDLDPRVYIILLKSLADQGINITKAALKIVDEPHFSFFVPEHAMNFMQGYCLMYCLLSLEPDMYFDELKEAFRLAKHVDIQKSIVTTFWFAYSCKGDVFLNSLNETNTLSKEVSEYAGKLLSSRNLDKSYKKKLPTITEKELKVMETEALKHFSDEAIYDLDFVTKARRKKFECFK